MLIAIYVALFAATSLYAAILNQLRRVAEPDLSWLEVAIGVAICLTAPALAARWVGGSWEEYEMRTWIAFLVGGFPIVVWQFGLIAAALRSIEQRTRSTHGQGSAASVADKRGSGAQTDD